MRLVAVVSLIKSSIYCIAFSLEIETEVSTMDIPFSRVKSFHGGFYETRILEVDGQTVAFFGVFDGMA